MRLSGHLVQSAELAKLRAIAVRDAFKAASVANDKMELQESTEITTGSNSAAEGRRVEVSLQ